ncbi:heat-inducible transcriptional repressor HrcA [Slackia heliotrinireducens]|uniref:heat-inducible transcriptional repressor HrcA n=1 Tax=Slackia heliotrinireducens TaxID=84110 RepID=UPI00331642E9
MLSERRQRVLEALIEEYVAFAQPVGSRTLVDRYKLGVSPATVRNELSVLEDEGYIRSPHTSAGRIPTDAGYRAFVDELLEREYGTDVAGSTFDELRSAATAVDELMDQTSAALSRLTDCLSVVLAPSVIGMSVKQVSLVSMTPHRVLVVVVTDDGQVFNRTVEFNEEIPSDELAHLQNAINGLVNGANVSDMRKRMSQVDSETLASPLAHAIIEEIILCINQGDASRTHRLGLSSLLRKPEFSHAQTALPVLQVLEDDTVLMQMFDRALADTAKEDLKVSIGRENGTEELSGVSVVAAQYGTGAGSGIVAVIGPTRMDYSTVIHAVRAAKNALRDL